MVARWIRASFLVILGLLLVVYGDGFVTDLETHASQEWSMSFQWTWDLLTYLIWIIIAWLFVYAAMTVALSFKMDTYTLGDVMERLESIERRFDSEKTEDSAGEPEEAVQTVPEEDGSVPPPPRE